MKKSQAAFEFLVTYGWAIAIASVSIVALAYLGVLSPDKILPRNCIIRPGIACLDIKINTSAITIVLKNSMGYNMDAVGIWVGNCGAAGYLSLSWLNWTYEEYLLRNNQQKTYQISCKTSLASGTKFKNQLNITLKNEGTGLTHKYIGIINNEVE